MKSSEEEIFVESLTANFIRQNICFWKGDLVLKFF